MSIKNFKVDNFVYVKEKYRKYFLSSTSYLCLRDQFITKLSNFYQQTFIFKMFISKTTLQNMVHKSKTKKYYRDNIFNNIIII